MAAAARNARLHMSPASSEGSLPTQAREDSALLVRANTTQLVFETTAMPFILACRLFFATVEVSGEFVREFYGDI